DTRKAIPRPDPIRYRAVPKVVPADARYTADSRAAGWCGCRHRVVKRRMETSGNPAASGAIQLSVSVRARPGGTGAALRQNPSRAVRRVCALPVRTASYGVSLAQCAHTMGGQWNGVFAVIRHHLPTLRVRRAVKSAAPLSGRGPDLLRGHRAIRR